MKLQLLHTLYNEQTVYNIEWNASKPSYKISQLQQKEEEVEEEENTDIMKTQK
jgi:hypothetical protein